MQLFQQPFNAQTVKPSEAFEPLPAGWYNARIVASEAKPTKDNESGYLQLDLEVIDGEHKGRKVFDRLNLWNKSVQASEIAQHQLSAYCHATGVMILQDSTQLHGIPIKVRLSVRQDAGYESTNDVKAVKHIQEATPSVAPSAGIVTAGAPSPFGMAPSLPAMPAPGTVAPSFTQVPAPAMPPQQTQPIQAGQPWAPPAAAPTPVAGPVPPWRK